MKVVEYSTIDLRGSNGARYTIDAYVAAGDGETTFLRLRDGRNLTVPTSAIQRIRHADSASPPSVIPAAPGKNNDEYAQRIKEFERSIADWPGTPTGDSTPTDWDLTNRIEWLRLRLDDLSQAPMNAKLLGDVQRVDRLCEHLLARLAEPKFTEAKRIRNSYLPGLKSANYRGKNRLTQVLRRCVAALRDAELEDWRRFSDRFVAHPHIQSQQRLTIHVDSNGEFQLPIRVALTGSEVDATDVRVVLDQYRGVEVVGQLPTIGKLLPGSAKTVQVRLLDRRRQGASDTVRLRAHLSYVGPNNETLTSAHQKMSIDLRARAAFQEIPNPFRDYASGVPVDDPQMFFGRESLISDIVTHLTQRPVGRCYGLYGQKRSGKSSVTGQVRAAIFGDDAIVCQLSMGTIDRSAITESFVAETLDQLREQLASRLSRDTFANLLTRWPDQRELSAGPLAGFRRAVNVTRALLRKDGRKEPRVILIVDEFTYLYELLRRDHVAEADQHQLRDFMRQWKGWLEAKLFSALVVGQDTMPAFLNAFANEFSVMHTERLDYLLPHETEALAERPIRKDDGTSRFTGYALASIHEYTGGHPFFSQILCDRIVTVANEQKRTDISEVDVDAAVETLISGSREIGVHRFDCLLSADNTGILLHQTSDDPYPADNDVARDVMQRIALVSGPQNKPISRDALELSSLEELVFDDLCRRNVLTIKDGRYQIRVLLFSEYVRRTIRG